jgi:hypothetical protein
MIPSASASISSEWSCGSNQFIPLIWTVELRHILLKFQRKWTVGVMLATAPVATKMRPCFLCVHAIHSVCIFADWQRQFQLKISSSFATLAMSLQDNEPIYSLWLLEWMPKGGKASCKLNMRSCSQFLKQNMGTRWNTHTSDVPPPLLSGLGTGNGSVRHPLPHTPTSINKKIKQEIKNIQSPVPQSHQNSSPSVISTNHIQRGAIQTAATIIVIAKTTKQTSVSKQHRRGESYAMQVRQTWNEYI